MSLIEIPKGLRRPKARTAEPAAAARPWYRFANAGDVEAELFIFDEIGYDWWSDAGVVASDFVRELADLRATSLTVHINSPGGDVFDGIAIANALRDHQASVHVIVDALAASIASVIALAGDTITMNRNSEMMIHDVSGGAYGNAADMTEMAALLDKVSNNIAAAYADRAGGGVKKWRDLMRAETWFDAQETVDVGLADKVQPLADRGAEKVAARWQAALGHTPKDPVGQADARSVVGDGQELATAVGGDSTSTTTTHTPGSLVAAGLRRGLVRKA
jgi:ATP-dependent protease ClpP protease subunit